MASPSLFEPVQPGTTNQLLLTPSGTSVATGGQIQNISNDPASPVLMWWPDNETYPGTGQIRPKFHAGYPPVRNTGNKGPILHQPGDWVCTQCNYLNWRRRKVCRTCLPYATGNDGAGGVSGRYSKAVIPRLRGDHLNLNSPNPLCPATRTRTTSTTRPESKSADVAQSQSEQDECHDVVQSLRMKDTNTPDHDAYSDLGVEGSVIYSTSTFLSQVDSDSSDSEASDETDTALPDLIPSFSRRDFLNSFSPASSNETAGMVVSKPIPASLYFEGSIWTPDVGERRALSSWWHQ